MKQKLTEKQIIALLEEADSNNPDTAKAKQAEATLQENGYLDGYGEYTDQVPEHIVKMFS